MVVILAVVRSILRCDIERYDQHVRSFLLIETYKDTGFIGNVYMV